jgi:arylformamidase
MLFAVVGEDESEEHLRQNRLIRDAWGERSVPVCETIPGRHHFDVVDTFADPSAHLHCLTLRLLGLTQTEAS